MPKTINKSQLWWTVSQSGCAVVSLWLLATILLPLAGDLYAQQAVAEPGSGPVSAPGIVASASRHLPHDLSPLSMFLNADVIVQAVILGLAFASLVTWTVWLAKTVELYAARRKLARMMAQIDEQASLSDASARVRPHRGVLLAMINAARVELGLSADILDGSGTKERVASRLARLETAAGRAMNKGTGLLATIGATAPFVGLFGTVWGIMNSFVGISKAQTTNLAIVAPGIAEALMATAVGLFAAIPAVVIYNQFARSIASYRALLGDASAHVLRLVSRDLDRNYGRRPLSSAAE
jgi:biopolymer transport protein ExbB